MKKLYSVITIAALVLAAGGANAQELPQLKAAMDKTKIRCYTTEAILETRRNNPLAETDAQFEAWMSAKIEARHAAKTTIINYTLPIVFHIISAGEVVGTTPNIAASLVNAQVLQLNQSFANQAGSPYAVAANTGLQFALAQFDPLGVAMAEPGIDRINRVSKDGLIILPLHGIKLTLTEP